MYHVHVNSYYYTSNYKFLRVSKSSNCLHRKFWQMVELTENMWLLETCKCVSTAVKALKALKSITGNKRATLTLIKDFLHLKLKTSHGLRQFTRAIIPI